jgi:hypothetical protein
VGDWTDDLLDDDDELDELQWRLDLARHRSNEQEAEIARLKREQWKMLGAFGLFVVVAAVYIVAMWPGGC